MEAGNLYDHYKDTFQQQKEYIAKRDRLTISLLLTVVLFATLLSNPETLTTCVNQYIRNNYQIKKVMIDFAILHTGMIYLLLWFILQYYQICLTIEKQYCYIWHLETELTKRNEFISREGLAYANSYPLLKNVANILYAWGIPIGISALSLFRFINESKTSQGYIILDSLGLAFIFILSLLYFSDRNLNWHIWKSNTSLFNKLKGFIKLDVD